MRLAEKLDWRGLTAFFHLTQHEVLTFQLWRIAKGFLKYHVPNVIWKLSGDARPEVNINASKSLHCQPGNTSIIDALTETSAVLQYPMAICHR
jgi:hypothetical protein